MTFDELYLKHFPTMVRYCHVRNGGDLYLAEEAAEKAFLILYQKWESLISHEEIFLKSWLTGACQNTMHEVLRTQPPMQESLNEPWCLELIEKEQWSRGDFYDFESENQRFTEYVREIEAHLKSKERLLFHCLAVEKRSCKDTAIRLRISENAVKSKWCRLKKKLRPLLLSLLDIENHMKGGK